MSLIKNEIPILEYDTDSRAVLMPDRFGRHFTKKAVLLFMEPEIEAYVARNPCEVIGELISVTKTFYVYKTKHRGEEITFVQVPLGGAGAVQIMEQMIGAGVEKIIAAGCCGALEKGAEGDFFIPTAALRQEGTSYHYLPPSREVELSEEGVMAIEKALTEKFGQLLFTADSLANVEAHDERNWGNDSFAAAMELAMNAAVLLP